MVLRAKSLEELPRVEAWKARGELAQVDGVELFYVATQAFAESDAAKPLLVLVHGYPTASFDFIKILPELEARFEVLCWDMCGYGLSTKRYASVRRQVELLEGLLEQRFGASTSEPLAFHVLSHDLGDTVMQEMLARVHEAQDGAAKCNFDVQSVVALNGGLLPGQHRPTLVQRLLINRWVGPLAAMFVGIGIFKISLSKVFGPDTKPSDEEVEELYYLASCNGGDSLVSVNIRYMQDRVENKARYEGALKRFAGAKGVLLIDGPADPVSGRHLGLAVRNEVAGAQVEFLGDNIGHWPQLEDPRGTLDRFFAYHDALRQGSAAPGQLVEGEGPSAG